MPDPTDQTPPPALPLPPGHKSNSAEISAAFEAFAPRLIEHAPEQLGKLWGDLHLMSPETLRGVIETRLTSPAYQHFLRMEPVADPYSHAALVEKFRDNMGGDRVVGTTADGRKIIRVAAPSPAAERAASEQRTKIEEGRAAERSFWQELSALPSAERLHRLAERYKAGVPGQSKVQAKKK